MFHESLSRREQRKNGGLGVDMRNKTGLRVPRHLARALFARPNPGQRLQIVAEHSHTYSPTLPSTPHMTQPIVSSSWAPSLSSQSSPRFGTFSLSLYPPFRHTTPVPIILACPHFRPLTLYFSYASTPSVSCPASAPVRWSPVASATSTST
jgi:hypothetical protein